MKRQLLVLLLFMVSVLMAAAPLRAGAEDLQPKDIAEVQAAVKLQIDALTKDDAASAFALTTEETRNRLKTPDNFMQVIKEHYDPVYRHRLAIYATPKLVHGKVYQVVRLVDFDSNVWVAIYLMLKDKDGTWKTDGCELLETTTVAI